MNLRPSKFNHVFWADLYGKGVMEEIVVIAQDKIGNVWYIPIKNLDEVDRRRIVRIITDRQASILPLFEVMASTKLGNGMNALEYFHQLVKIHTPSGQIIDPRSGMLGTAMPVQPTPPTA